MTETMTDTLPLALVPLPSGATGAVVYALDLGDVTIAALLLAMVLLQVLHLWRTR
jgi:hypothetical protein